jgi:hypothetical protein
MVYIGTVGKEHPYMIPHLGRGNKFDGIGKK